MSRDKSDHGWMGRKVRSQEKIGKHRAFAVRGFKLTGDDGHHTLPLWGLDHAILLSKLKRTHGLAHPSTVLRKADGGELGSEKSSDFSQVTARKWSGLDSR